MKKIVIVMFSLFTLVSCFGGNKEEKKVENTETSVVNIRSQEELQKVRALWVLNVHWVEYKTDNLNDDELNYLLDKISIGKSTDKNNGWMDFEEFKKQYNLEKKLTDSQIRVMVINKPEEAKKSSEPRVRLDYYSYYNKWEDALKDDDEAIVKTAKEKIEILNSFKNEEE